MSKPSDQFMRLTVVKINHENASDEDVDISWEHPFSLHPEVVCGWTDQEVTIAQKKEVIGCAKVTQSAEEIEAEYNRAVEAGKDE